MTDCVLSSMYCSSYNAMLCFVRLPQLLPMLVGIYMYHHVSTWFYMHFMRTWYGVAFNMQHSPGSQIHVYLDTGIHTPMTAAEFGNGSSDNAYCQHKRTHKLGATVTSLKSLFLIISNQWYWNSDGQDCVRVTLTTLPTNTSTFDT